MPTQDGLFEQAVNSRKSQKNQQENLKMTNFSNEKIPLKDNVFISLLVRKTCR